MEGSKGSCIWQNAGNSNLRHNDDAEVQPVPRVPQEGEGPDAETPRQDFYQRLERVNASERVPGRKRERRDGQEVRPGGMENKTKNPGKIPHRDHERSRNGHRTHMVFRGDVKHIHSPAAPAWDMDDSRCLMSWWSSRQERALKSRASFWPSERETSSREDERCSILECKAGLFLFSSFSS